MLIAYVKLLHSNEDKQPENDNSALQALDNGEQSAKIITTFYHTAKQFRRHQPQPQQPGRLHQGSIRQGKLPSGSTASQAAKRSSQVRATRTSLSSSSTIKPASSVISQVSASVKQAVQQGWKGFAAAAIVALILLQMLSAMSSAISFSSQSLASLLATTYTAEEDDITAADLQYSLLEASLEEAIRTIEETKPGFDEYRYSVDPIGHDPFVLLSFLSAFQEAFAHSEVSAEISSLFADCYALRITEIVEIRYRTEIRYVSGVDNNGNSYSYSYSVQVPYNYYILEVDLQASFMETVALSRLNDDQRERYALYMETHGARQFLHSPVLAPWGNNISSYYGYRQHPFDGGISIHRGLDIAAPLGTPIYAAHAGIVTTVHPTDSGDFGRYLIIQGDKGISTVYAHCSSINVNQGQEVVAGQPIATVGSTGLSTGAHLHLELWRSGENFNPLFFLEGY